MSKFNKKVTHNSMTCNNEGAKAYSMLPVDKLITQVLSTFFNEKKFYGDNSEDIKDNIREVMKKDSKFIANLAIYTRNKMNLRSISHVLVCELAHNINGKKYAREVIRKVCIRPDDMTEILAYYLNEFGKPIPNSMKKGLADALANFDEYQLAKYNRKTEVTLKDIVKLCHPKDSKGLYSKLLNDNLKTPVTWETQLSKHGNTQESWEKLINKNKLGYMAMLRNLKNILNSDVSTEAMKMVYEKLCDREQVLKSKQLPFRFYSAYKELENVPAATSSIFEVLETAIKHSCKNIKLLEGKTLIAVDVSWSMNGCTISDKSSIKVADIATLMGSMASYICEESIVVSFDTSLRKIALSNFNGIISNAKSIDVNGGGTNINLPFEYLMNKDIKVDRIILLSDNEINSGYDTKSRWNKYTSPQASLNQYRNKIGQETWLHGIDLQGYGTQQFRGPNVNIIAGWSEKILEFIHLAENGTGTLKKEIASYNFK